MRGSVALFNKSSFLLRLHQAALASRETRVKDLQLDVTCQWNNYLICRQHAASTRCCWLGCVISDRLPRLRLTAVLKP